MAPAVSINASMSYIRLQSDSEKHVAGEQTAQVRTLNLDTQSKNYTLIIIAHAWFPKFTVVVVCYTIFAVHAER